MKNLTVHSVSIKERALITLFAILSTSMGVIAPTGSAQAHHAMEYIEMESCSLALRGQSIFHLHYDYYVDDENNPALDHWEFTPGLAYGFTNRIMLDVHTHFAKFGSGFVDQSAGFGESGPSPFMEAAATTLQLKLTGHNAPFDAVLGLSGEFPFKRAKELLGHENGVYSLCLAVGRNFGEHRNVTLNLTMESEGDDISPKAAFGVKMPISPDPHGIAAGIEIISSLDGSEWYIFPGVYTPVGGDSVIFKTGIALGQTDYNATSRISSVVMFRF